MRLHLVAALAPQLAHQGMEGPQQIEIVALTGNRAGHGLDRCEPGVHDDLPWIGDKEGPRRGAKDDHELPGLHQHGEMPAHGGKAAEQRSNRDDDPYETAQPATPSPIPSEYLFGDACA